MGTFSALLAPCAGNWPVPGELPTQKPVTRSFDVSLISALNKRLSKQSWGWWFKTPPGSLWRHCNAMVWLELGGHCISDRRRHYSDVMMGTTASQITSLMIVYSTVYSGTNQRKHQSPASLAFVRVIHRWPVNSPHKGPVTRKMFPFDYFIMVPQTVFQLNSKYDQKSQCSGLRYAQPITSKIAHTTAMWLSRRVLIFVVCSAEYVMNTSITNFHWIANSIEISLVGRVSCQDSSGVLDDKTVNWFPVKLCFFFWQIAILLSDLRKLFACFQPTRTYSH